MSSIKTTPLAILAIIPLLAQTLLAGTDATTSAPPTFTRHNIASLWKFIETWEAGIRYGYVEGVTDPKLDDRH